MTRTDEKTGERCVIPKGASRIRLAQCGRLFIRNDQHWEDQDVKPRVVGAKAPKLELVVRKWADAVDTMEKVYDDILRDDGLSPDTKQFWSQAANVGAQVVPWLVTASEDRQVVLQRYSFVLRRYYDHPAMQEALPAVELRLDDPAGRIERGLDLLQAYAFRTAE